MSKIRNLQLVKCILYMHKIFLLLFILKYYSYIKFNEALKYVRGSFYYFKLFPDIIVLFGDFFGKDPAGMREIQSTG